MKDNTKSRMTTFIKTKFKISEEIGLLWSSQSFEGKYHIGFGIPIEFSSQRKKIFKSVHKQGNWTFVVQTVIWGKYHIRFGIPIEFPSQRKKNYSNQSRKNENGLLWSGQSFGESTISNCESQSKFQVKEKKIIQIGLETTKLCFN